MPWEIKYFPIHSKSRAFEDFGMNIEALLHSEI